MNDTSRQIMSTNKSISTPIAKFCRLTSRFCKILSIKTHIAFRKSYPYLKQVIFFHIPKFFIRLDEIQCGFSPICNMQLKA